MTKGPKIVSRIDNPALLESGKTFMEELRKNADETADLRANSDALLLACGWLRHDMTWEWWKPHGGESVGDDPKNRPHPYESIDDAVRLAEAMGLIISNIMLHDEGYFAALQDFGSGIHIAINPTIAEAIAEAILAAVKGKKPA